MSLAPAFCLKVLCEHFSSRAKIRSLYLRAKGKTEKCPWRSCACHPKSTGWAGFPGFGQWRVCSLQKVNQGPASPALLGHIVHGWQPSQVFLVRPSPTPRVSVLLGVGCDCSRQEAPPAGSLLPTQGPSAVIIRATSGWGASRVGKPGAKMWKWLGEVRVAVERGVGGVRRRGTLSMAPWNGCVCATRSKCCGL